jgi:hypothetical protein
MNNPLATLSDQFLKERTYLKNVTPRTLVWYQVAFKCYRKSLSADTPVTSDEGHAPAVCRPRMRPWAAPRDLQHLHRGDERFLCLAAPGDCRSYEWNVACYCC